MEVLQRVEQLRRAGAGLRGAGLWGAGLWGAGAGLQPSDDSREMGEE